MKRFFLFLIVILYSIVSFTQSKTSRSAKDLNCIIKFELSEKFSYFNSDALADSTLMNIDGENYYGFKTKNQEVFEEVMKPAILDCLDELKKLPEAEIINQLTIFVYQIYQEYFGKSFYRWGGDIFDLDDPQIESIRYKYKFGLDCSGFTASGYELAAYFNLIPIDELIFSSKGFKLFCEETGFEDTGGLVQRSNNYRLDTKELDKLSKEILRLVKNEKIKDEQISELQAGDIVGRNGHFGILVQSDGELYFLESGGYAVPYSDYNAVEAKTAINKFAESGYVSIRRSLK